MISNYEDEQIIQIMTAYIKEHDIPSLIELVLKAIERVDKE